MSRIYVALDLETTGLQSDRDAIVEIGAVKFRGDEVLGEWSSFVNPGRALPHKIERLTGIDSRELEHAPALHQVLPPECSNTFLNLLHVLSRKARKQRKS